MAGFLGLPRMARPHSVSLIEPPQSAAEKMDACLKARPGTRRSPLGMRKGARPRPRGIAGISQAVSECAQEVSATADWLAERAVQREPVSPRPNSLIYGKIQGIRADSGAAGLAIGPDSLAWTRTWAPRSLEPGTGNFVLRSRDSYPRRWGPVERRAGPIRSVELLWGCVGAQGAVNLAWRGGDRRCAKIFSCRCRPGVGASTPREGSRSWRRRC